MEHPTCSVPACERQTFYRSEWCRRHRDRWLDHGTLEKRPHRLSGRAVRGPLAPRFWAKVDKSGDCWEWRGGMHRIHGYGSVWVAERGGMVHAHRVAWQLTNGEIPKGLHVLHRCDNRIYVRPDHLFLGTHQDNMRDMRLKGRAHSTGGRWATRYDACIDCGQTSRFHRSKGRCWKCDTAWKESAA